MGDVYLKSVFKQTQRSCCHLRNGKQDIEHSLIPQMLYAGNLIMIIKTRRTGLLPMCLIIVYEFLNFADWEQITIMSPFRLGSC
jgi:hypothetical protein